MEKRKKKISTEQSTGSLSWMYGAAFSPEPVTVLTVDNFTATKLVYRFQMLRFALLINAFISDLYYKITGSPIVQICFSAAYVKLREC